MNCQERSYSGSSQYDRLIGRVCGRPAKWKMRPRHGDGYLGDASKLVCGVHRRVLERLQWEVRS